MRKTATKALSLFLALTMLMSLVCVPAGAKVIQDGTNGKTIYLSTKATLKKGGEEATTVAANSTFVVEVNFANNPTVLEDSIQGFDLFVKYDNTKMTATNVVNGLTVVVANKAYGSDTVKMAWASESGISIVDDDTLENVVQASGTLAYIAFKATTDLTASDLAAFEFPATGTGNEVAGMSDGNSKKFTIVQTPALDVSVKDGVTLYNTSSKQDIKNALTVMYIDASGKQTAVTDFEVDKASLTVGENIITVTANGISEKVTVTAVADTVESIAVTKQPNKRVYTSGDKLDLTGMEITATYESGATEVVTTGYTTDVEVGTVMTVKEYGPSKIITVTYEGKTAQTWALTVNPRLVTIPTVKGTYTYNGNEQELVLNHAENWEKYYTLSGILKGKEAKNYTAYATLIDDDETRWTDGSEDVQTLTWTIAPNEGDLTLTPVSDDSITYNGKEQKPEYTVTSGGKTLTAGTDYTLSYSNNIDAGTATVTATGKGNYAGATGSAKFTIAKAAVALTWSGADTRTYDGKASNVTASVTNKIGNDDVTVTVTGGTAVNAGTYTAAATGLAGAKAGNYQLPETGLSQSYTIGKAARTLSGLADLTLAGDTLSAALQPQVNDLDQSARFTYESSNTAAVTVNAQGVVSAVANGTATVTVTVPATANYEAAETSVTVKAVTQAITAVSAAPDTVSAALQGKTIVLSGYAESITVTPTYYDGVRLKSGSLTVKAGETAGIVLTVGGRDIPWTIDASAVVVKPANVTVATDDEVAKAPDADETITDEVLNAIAGGNTTASGLDQAAAGLIPEAAKNAPEGTAAVELTFVTQILPESYQNGVLVLEIRPVAQYKYLDQQGNAIKTEEKAIANSDIQGLVTLSVQLPAGMPVADLYARHELGGGQYEYLPVTVENGAATWQQGSFSRVSLIADARSAAITFRMPDGSEQTVTYTPENIGQSLPAASRAGYRFDGWKFPGIDGTYKTLTDELLTALNGKTLTAEAQFTVMGGGGGGGGGFVSAGYAVSIAKTENGTVTASAETAEEGETITLTVKAETGYVLKTLTAAAEGKDLTLTAGKNGTYTFTMPAADVTVTAVFEKIAFADVKSGSYCYDAVQWAVAKGITLGMSDGSFAPNAPCTRGQIVTFLWRAMGCPAPKSTVNPFTDVKSGSYCYEAVLWAVEQGITKGTTATTFSPNAPCTRGQAVTFLCRAVGTEGTGDTGFADVGANSFCAGSVKWAVENGVTKGITATTFSPNETCTRGQIVTFLYRAMGK